MQFFRCFILLFSIPTIQCLENSNKLLLENLNENNNRNVLECLEALINVTDWVVDSFVVISDDTNLVDNDFIQKQSNFGFTLYSRTNNNSLKGFSNAILFTKDFYQLNKTLKLINIKQIDARAKFVISVKRNFASLDEIKVESEGITAVMWKLDKTQVVYLVHSKKNILLMTYFPFVNNCQPGELEIVDVWNDHNFEKQVELFPKKMTNIHNCVQNHSSMIDEENKFQLHIEFKETGETVLGGIGGRLVTIIAKKINMRLNLLPIPESWDILTDQIITGESLLSIAGNIPTAERLETLDMNSAFTQEAFSFGYISGGFEIPWNNFMAPLSKESWFYIGLILIIFGSMIFLISQYKSCEIIINDRLKILDSFGMFLGNSQSLPRNYFARYLLGIWIIYSYLVSAYYDSGLISYLTTPNERRVINTFEELLADGMEFGDVPFHREFYYEPSDPVMMKIYNKFQIWEPKESRDLLYSGQAASGVLSSNVYQFNSDHAGNINCQLRMLEDRVFTFHAPLCMRRGSPFAIIIKRYTLQVIESGLLDYWRKYETRAWVSSKMSSATDPPKISMQHLRGILYLLIFGLICSTVTFMLEIMFYKYLSNRNLRLSNS